MWRWYELFCRVQALSKKDGKLGSIQRENSRQDFNENGFFKASVKGLERSLDKIFIYLKEVAFTVANHLDIKIKQKNFSDLSEKQCYRLLEEIYFVNQNAFSFIYDVMNRSSVLYQMMQAEIVLDAANPDYDSIKLNPDKVSVQGKLLAVWRKC